MNKVILQFWEETDKHKGIIPDGCSLHIDTEERNEYLFKIYMNRDDDIPVVYDRIVGDSVIAFIGDNIYESLKVNKSIKLSENEYQNLIKFEEMLFNFIKC